MDIIKNGGDWVYCKKCNSINLTDRTMEVLDIEDENYITIKGFLCIDCGCFHYSLGEYDIHQWLVEGPTSNDACGKWLTDYNAKINENI